MSNKPAREEDLRKRAEKRLSKKSGIKSRQQPGLPSQEAEELLHELRVHQVELEMQNEELRSAQIDLADSRRKYAELFDQAPVGYFVLDFEGLVRDANSTAVGMLSTTKRTLIGKPLSLHIHASDRHTFLEHQKKVLKSHDRLVCSVRMKKKDGDIFHARLQSTRLEEGEKTEPVCLTTATDISQLKALEKEREEYIRDLEAFGYTASHELRSPLVSIGGFSKILREDYADRLDEEGRKLLYTINERAGKMERLLTDLMQFSQIGAKKMSVEDLDMASLVRSAYGDLSPAAEEQHVNIDIGKLPPARGDAQMMRMVFVNLLSNALKFSSARNNAVIEIRGTKGESENIYSVKDNGVGFDMNYAGKLFRIFQRLHSEREFPGTGAGLSITKRIIEKHGGRIWAEGRPGEGATFYFTLPAAQPL
jgi:PAS domain S-box-containing protein